MGQSNQTNLTTTQLSALSTTDLGALSSTDIGALSSTDLGSLGTTQIIGMTTVEGPDAAAFVVALARLTALEEQGVVLDQTLKSHALQFTQIGDDLALLGGSHDDLREKLTKLATDVTAIVPLSPEAEQTIHDVLEFAAGAKDLITRVEEAEKMLLRLRSLL